MKMQEKFKQTFDEVHAPEDLLGKVMELDMKKKEFKTRNMVKAAVCALAVATGVFAAGNGICYAATGESLMTNVKIIINGEELDAADMQWQKHGEEWHGSTELTGKDGISRGVDFTTVENPEDIVIDIVTEEETGEDGKVEETVRMEVDEEDVDSVMYEEEEKVNSSEDMDETE